MVDGPATIFLNELGNSFWTGFLSNTGPEYASSALAIFISKLIVLKIDGAFERGMDSFTKRMGHLEGIRA